MTTIIEHIERIKQAKADIKAALIEKGVDVGDNDTIDSFAGKVREVVSESPTAIDFGNRYGAFAESIKEDLEFTKVVEEMLDYTFWRDIQDDRILIPFKGKEYKFSERIAFWPRHPGFYDPNNPYMNMALPRYGFTYNSNGAKAYPCLMEIDSTFTVTSEYLSYSEYGTPPGFAYTGIHCFSAKIEGEVMFTSFMRCWNLKRFDSDVNNIIEMPGTFVECTALNTFDRPMNSLIVGEGTFVGSGLMYFRVDSLPALINASSMFSQSIITRFNCTTPNLSFGNYMFYDTPITEFRGDLSSLTDGSSMFEKDSEMDHSLEIFEPTSLENLAIGTKMFMNQFKNSEKGVKSFLIDMPKLIDGTQMFYYCGILNEYMDVRNGLTEFRGNLDSLTTGYKMFELCRCLETFDSSLPSLESGEWMFGDCDSLTTTPTNLVSLTNGNSMFYHCYALTDVDLELPALVEWKRMFYWCTSLKNVRITLPKSFKNATVGWAPFEGCKALENVFIKNLGEGLKAYDSSKLTPESIAYMLAHGDRTQYLEFGVHSTAYNNFLSSEYFEDKGDGTGYVNYTYEDDEGNLITLRVIVRKYNSTGSDTMRSLYYYPEDNE